MADDVFPGGYSKPIPDLYLDYLISVGRAERSGDGVFIPGPGVPDYDEHRPAFLRYVRQFKVEGQ